MVFTRRSRSTAGDDNSVEHGALVGGLGPQEDVSSRSVCRETIGATPAVLQPVVEEPAAAAAVSGYKAQEDPIPTQGVGPQTISCAPEEQTGTSSRRQQQQQAQGQQQQQSTLVRPMRHHWQPMNQHQQMPPAAVQLAPARASPGADYAVDTDSDNADWDFDGPDMLQNLAATIRSALGSTTGAQQKQKKEQQHLSIAAAGGGGRSHDDMDPESLKWRPSTGLHLPHKAAQLVQSAVAALPPKQQHELATSGPTVQGPASAASAEVEPATGANAPEAAAVALKPQGLARHSRVPSLDPAAAAKEARKQKPETAGKKWFGLPAVKITDEVKRDLRLLRLRGAYDPKRFYRSFDETKFPKHFAVGTVVDDPLDFHGGRLSKGQRKASLAEQLLADSELTSSRRKRYNKLQEDANKWVKHKKRKTDMPRKTPSKHRPKH